MHELKSIPERKKNNFDRGTTNIQIRCCLAEKRCVLLVEVTPNSFS